ncbi:response regulator transcription factor [Pararobbsia alpina]|uniref:Sensor histidine kinase RcsC n=1 Tax=Pararobbsia alpina TaxID=621374 RepID=A0A6S7BL73_9BURK|nr:response regulator [Pararobbsia alpina]CAB3802888.1 Sensor histidine kinase RcsC [Pararobbsia alpina]
MSTPNAVRLLIADDDPNVLEAYVLFFGAHGYNTRTTGDGSDALAEYRAWRPDAVVLDIQMPGMDGRAVAREIRRLHSAPLPLLVAVTALISPSEHAESIESGFDYHFVKPADLPLVLATIASRVRPSAVDDA